MKNPNAAAFLAIILICIGAFCAWAAPSLFYQTTYPNSVPMTDPGNLQMVNPPVMGTGGEQAHPDKFYNRQQIFRIAAYTNHKFVINLT